MEYDSDDSSGLDEETDIAIQEYLDDSNKETQQLSPPVVHSAYDLESITMLKSALVMNKETEVKYHNLERCLYKALADVRMKLNNINSELMKDAKADNEDKFSYLRSGRPYFKDKNNHTPPDNYDTVMMKQANMYDFSLISSVPGWTVKDKTQLVNALLIMSRNLKKDELYEQMAQLRKDESGANLIQIAKLEKEIKQLGKKSLAEIALPLDQEYDWETLANSLNRRHTAQEYQALWKLFFHPSINKSNWSRYEHQQLQKIATSFRKQDWDNIAANLNTGRTGYQCFVYYRTNMSDITSNRPWTSEEIEYLQRVIDYFREGTYIPWGKVATAMESRTKIQVYNKYTRMIERRKGRFLEEEDIVIINCYNKYGKNFKKIAEYLPGRSQVQLRTRFNLLTKFRLSKTWTIEDDKKLIQIMANDDSSASFSTATLHFPGKDRMHIRSRYKTLTRWMQTHPATDIEMAPRRGARRLLHGHATINLNEAVENLRKRMESEVKAKRIKKITRHSDESDIEDGIMATLITEILKEEKSRSYLRQETGEENNTYPITAETGDETPDTASLRKLLVFLNSSLDKDKFVASKYANKFPELIESHEVSQIKIKSYSKKQSVKTVIVKDTPDVWGNLQLPHSSFVMPPNYASITGCRVLMKNVESRPDLEDEINLSLMSRRNEQLKEALNKLRERFTKMFLWPMLLSNEPPTTIIDERPYVPKKLKQKAALPEVPGVTIPVLSKYLLKYQTSQENTLKSNI